MRVLVPFAAMLSAVMFGCTSGSEGADDAGRDAAIYGLVIDHMAERSGFDGDAEDPPVIFVESFHPDGIPLEVQVAVIAELSEQFEIRFIDLRDEAVDDDLAKLPVRPESLLIGLGSIVLDDTASVRAESYVNSATITAFIYEMSGADGRWTIQDGSPLSVAPEGFVSAP